MIAVLDAAGVGRVPISRYVGYKVGTLAGDTYFVGGSRVNSIKTAQKIRFEADVEAAAVVKVTQQPANVK